MIEAPDHFEPLVNLLARRVAAEVVAMLHGGGALPDKDERINPTLGDVHIEAFGPALERRALRELHQRKNREKYFPADIFSEGMWNILLDLFVNKGKGKRIGISSACLASNVPLTTALRLLQVLISHDLIIRTPSEEDARMAFVEISPLGYKSMAEYLKTLK